LAAELAEWREQSKDPSPEAFIFPGRFGGFMDSSNFRRRVLHRLAEELELPKLTFQVIRRTIATLAQNKGTVKDVQGMMRHSRTATTTDVYMQELPEGVRATVNSMALLQIIPLAKGRRGAVFTQASSRLEFELFPNGCDGLGERTGAKTERAFYDARLAVDVLREVEDRRLALA